MAMRAFSRSLNALRNASERCEISQSPSSKNRVLLHASSFVSLLDVIYARKKKKKKRERASCTHETNERVASRVRALASL